jgi:hypothetical protein
MRQKAPDSRVCLPKAGGSRHLHAARALNEAVAPDCVGEEKGVKGWGAAGRAAVG